MANSNRAPYEGGTILESGRLFSGSEVMVLKSFFDGKEAADNERRNVMERRLDVFRDDWLSILRGRIFSAFERQNAEEMAKVADITNNPMKRIVQDVSTIYDKPATWSFAEGVDAEPWQKVLAGACADVVMPQLNRITNLCNEGVLYISPHKRRLKFHVVAPSDVQAWQDPEDPSQPIALMVRSAMVNTTNATPVWHFWSRNPEKPVYKRLDHKGRTLLEFENPYRDEDGEPVIPAVIYHREWPMGELWDCTSGNDLYEATILLGFLETWVNHLVRTDSIQQKYVSGRLDVDAPQVGGPLSFLQFRSPDGTPVTVGQFSSQADWQGLGSIIARKLQNVLNNNGLSMQDFEISGDAQSGFALRVRKEKLVEMRERQVPIYRTWDMQLYDTVAAVWNFERRNRDSLIDGPPLPWSSVAEPTVTYSQFQTSLTVQEKQAEFALNKERMAMGLESPVSIYLKEHPGESEDDAIAAIQENKRLARELQGRPMNDEGVPAPPQMGGSAPDLAAVLSQRIAQRAREQEEKQKPAPPPMPEDGQEADE